MIPTTNIEPELVLVKFKDGVNIAFVFDLPGRYTKINLIGGVSSIMKKEEAKAYIRKNKTTYQEWIKSN